MLHMIFGKGPWFRAKRFGYGTGLPFTWQGWLFLIFHIALLVGLGLIVERAPLPIIALMFLAAIGPIPVYKTRTEGNWQWRWGGEERPASPRED